MKDSSKPSKKEKSRKKKKTSKGLTVGEVKEPLWNALERDDDDIPFKFRCPVSLHMMWEPVRLIHTQELCENSGHVSKYGKHCELLAIQECWKHKPGLDPLSNEYLDPRIEWHPEFFKPEDDYEKDIELRNEMDEFRRSLTHDQRKAMCDFNSFKSKNKLRLAIQIMKGTNEQEKNQIAFLYGKMEDWDVKAITDFSGLFKGVKGMNMKDIRKWSTEQVVNMESTFENCSDFCGYGLEHWNVEKVQSLQNCFRGCHLFNANLEHWNLISCNCIIGAFRDCKSFEGKGLNAWQLKNVVHCSEAFYGCAKFDVDVGNWQIWGYCVGSKYRCMFAGCKSFRGVGMRSIHWKQKSFNREDYVVAGMFHGCNKLEQLPPIRVATGNPMQIFFQNPTSWT